MSGRSSMNGRNGRSSMNGSMNSIFGRNGRSSMNSSRNSSRNKRKNINNNRGFFKRTKKAPLSSEQMETEMEYIPQSSSRGPFASGFTPQPSSRGPFASGFTPQPSGPIERVPSIFPTNVLNFDYIKNVINFSDHNVQVFNYIKTKIQNGNDISVDIVSMIITYSEYNDIVSIKKHDTGKTYFPQYEYKNPTPNPTKLTEQDLTHLNDLTFTYILDQIIDALYHSKSLDYNEFILYIQKFKYFDDFILNIKKLFEIIINNNISEQLNKYKGPKIEKYIDKLDLKKDDKTRENIASADTNTNFMGKVIKNYVLNEIKYALDFIIPIFDQIYDFIKDNNYNIIFIDLENLCLMEEYGLDIDSNPIDQNNMIALILKIIDEKYSDPTGPKIFPIFCTNNKNYRDKSFFINNGKYKFCLLSSFSFLNEIDDYFIVFLTLLMNFKDHLNIIKIFKEDKIKSQAPISNEVLKSESFDLAPYNIPDNLLEKCKKYMNVYLIFSYDKLHWLEIRGFNLKTCFPNIYICELDKKYNFIPNIRNIRSPPFKRIDNHFKIIQQKYLDNSELFEDDIKKHYGIQSIEFLNLFLDHLKILQDKERKDYLERKKKILNVELQKQEEEVTPGINQIKRNISFLSKQTNKQSLAEYRQANDALEKHNAKMKPFIEGQEKQFDDIINEKYDEELSKRYSLHLHTSKNFEEFLNNMKMQLNKDIESKHVEVEKLSETISKNEITINEINLNIRQLTDNNLAQDKQNENEKTNYEKKISTAQTQQKQFAEKEKHNEKIKTSVENLVVYLSKIKQDYLKKKQIIDDKITENNNKITELTSKLNLLYKENNANGFRIEEIKQINLEYLDKIAKINLLLHPPPPQQQAYQFQSPPQGYPPQSYGHQQQQYGHQPPLPPPQSYGHLPPLPPPQPYGHQQQYGQQPPLPPQQPYGHQQQQYGQQPPLPPQQPYGQQKQYGHRRGGGIKKSKKHISKSKSKTKKHNKKTNSKTKKHSRKH